MMVTSSEYLLQNKVSLPNSALKLIIELLKYVLPIHGDTCAMIIISKTDPVDIYLYPNLYLL